jgi:hypothetical protein
VLVAYRWLLVAAAFGLVAVAVSVVFAVRYAERHGTAPAGGATVGSVLAELLALALTVAVVYRMRAGDDWARTMLAVLGALVALLAAIIAMTRFSTDPTVVATFRSVTSAVRLSQVGAVVMAVWTMFRPAAADWFDPRRRDGLIGRCGSGGTVRDTPMSSPRRVPDDHSER